VKFRLQLLLLITALLLTALITTSCGGTSITTNPATQASTTQFATEPQVSTSLLETKSNIIYLTIDLAEIEWEPFVPIQFTVFIEPDSAELPENAIFDWDFGDGTVEQSVVKPGQKGDVFTHIYMEDRLFCLTVSLINSDTNEKVASVESKVTIDESLY